MDIISLTRADLVVATSGNPRESYLMSSGQLWTGIRSINISASSTLIANESTIRMVPGLSNFNIPTSKELQSLSRCTFIMTYTRGYTRVYLRDVEITGVTSVIFKHSIQDKDVDIKVTVSDPRHLIDIDVTHHHWLWIKTSSLPLRKVP